LSEYSAIALITLAVRARSWFREFREIALMCVVYNIKRAVKQWIPLLYGDSTQPLEQNVPESVWRAYLRRRVSNAELARQDGYYVVR